MNQLRKAIVAVAAAAAASAAPAAGILITFEGLSDGGFIGGAYSGMGVNFTPFFTSVIDSDAGGGATVQNQFANAPSGTTVAYAPSNIAGPGINFTSSFYEISFWYSAAQTMATVPSVVITDVNGGVSTVSLPYNNLPTPITAGTCASTPPGDTYHFFYGFCNWSLVTFVSAVPLQSVDFNGASNRVLIDNISLVPEPASLALVGAGLLAMGAARRRKA